MGYADKMVLAHDTNCFMDTIPRSVKEQRMPNWHFLHITRDILPALRRRGVSEEQIQTMLVENPRRVFERQGAY
jgi:phosphotriesterase-related protein